MSRCRNIRRKSEIAKYLFIFFVGLLITCASVNVYAQSDSSTMAPGRRHAPPPHPKPPSLKKFFHKINIFKKDKDQGQDQTQNQSQAQNNVTATDNANKTTEVAKPTEQVKPMAVPEAK